MKTFTWITTALLLLTFSCKPSEQLPNYGIDTTMEGIKGTVALVDADVATPKGVQREIYVFELANETQAENEGNLYRNIQTRLVRRIVTGMNGSFVLALPPGTYSVLASHENGYYADEKDESGNINPIVVRDGKFTDITININPALTY